MASRNRRQREIGEILGDKWEFDGLTGGDHLRWRHRPTGRVLTTSGTPRSNWLSTIRQDAKWVASGHYAQVQRRAAWHYSCASQVRCPDPPRRPFAAGGQLARV